MTCRPYINLAAFTLALLGISFGSASGQDLFGLVPDADTWLSNGAGSGPTATHGGESIMQLRWYDDGSTTRIRIPYIRYDISQINPDFFSTATLSGTFRDSGKDGPGSWQVWGLNDTLTAAGTAGVDWDELTVSYSNAAGMDNAAAVGTFGFSSDATQLGTIAVDTMDLQPLPFASNTTDLDLSSFLASDTDGLVTFILMDLEEAGGKEFYIDSRTGNTSDGHGPMTLNFEFPAGDVDGFDGVDLNDLQTIADNFRQAVDSRLDGDLDGNGFVDFDDFGLWKANYTGSLEGVNLGFLTAVPEPSSVMLAVLGAAGGALMVRRRNRKTSGMVASVVLLMVTFSATAHAQTAVRFRDPNSNVNPLPLPAGPDGDWNIDNNWWDPFDNNFIPEYSFGDGEVAYIENGGTAFVDMDGGKYPGHIYIGRTEGTTGGVEIRNGGVMNVQAGGATNGGVSVGESGIGTLEVFPGGTLTAVGTISVADGSTAMVHPGGTLSTTGPLAFSGNSNYQVEVTGAGVNGSISAGSAANLSGNLYFDFGSYSPVSTDTWTILEADAINGSFDSVSSNLSLAANQKFVFSKPDLGDGRVGLRAAIEEVLVLEVNRNTGEAIVKHTGGSTISLDGYYVGSDLGLLSDLDANWDSLVETGSLGADWVETSQTTNNIGELKVGADATIGSDMSLGNIYNPLAGTFAGATEDLEFVYRRSDGTQTTGIVQYTGSKVNNLLLQVAPSGDTYLRNPSSTTVEIDGYEILSQDGSLVTANWTSLADQSVTTNAWIEALNNSANQLVEFDSEGFTTLAPGAALNLGQLFAGGTQDLEFNFLLMGEDVGTAGSVLYSAYEGLLGDFNNDNTVDIADYVVWRNNLGGASLPNDNDLGTVGAAHYQLWKSNFGQSIASAASLAAASVPEPATWLMVGLAFGLVVARQRSR